MKIDIERLLCSLIECNTKSGHKYNWLADDIITSLRDQGLIYKDGQIISELEESEDERIRKYLIDMLKNDEKCYLKEIAWLEAQGEHANFRNKIQVGDKVTRNRDGMLVNLSQLKRVAKPADKVEPKFKVGDWIAYNHNPNLPPRKIIQIANEHYIFNNGSFEVKTLEADWHLWTIQDAKDGDVLANDFHEIFIFKNIKEDAVISYCSIIDRTSDVIVNSFDEIEVGCTSVVNFYPATKEQCDTLLKAMTDAGYTFDFEKRELKKIEQKPWSAEDEKILSNIIKDLVHPWNEYIPDRIEEEIKWLKNKLKSLKNRVQPQPKQEWSEDTQQWIDAIIKDYEGWYDADKDHRATIQVKINILKSLRPQNRWKPSDEQMKQLGWIAEQNKDNMIGKELMTLYNDLKKLKE